MNIDEFFEVFTGGNSNVATWTPKAIKEFAEDYHNQQLRLHNVVVPKGTFFCGENELRSKKRCDKQCDTCFDIKNN